MQLASAHALAHGDLTAQRQAAAVQHEMHQGLELAADQGGLEHQAAVAAGDVEQLARGVGVLGQGNGMGMHLGQGDAGMPGQRMRSEEHTSELQSQSNLVCRLLLEKKKKQETQLRTHPKIYLQPYTVAMLAD